MLIFLIGFGVYFIRAVKYLRNHEGVEYCWPLVFLVLTFLSNLTGANFLSRNALLWIVYVATGALTVAKQKEWVASKKEPARTSALGLPGGFAPS